MIDLRWYRSGAASQRAEETSSIAGPPLPSDGSDQTTASETGETSPVHTATFPVQLTFLFFFFFFFDSILVRLRYRTLRSTLSAINKYDCPSPLIRRLL